MLEAVTVGCPIAHHFCSQILEHLVQCHQRTGETLSVTLLSTQPEKRDAFSTQVRLPQLL